MIGQIRQTVFSKRNLLSQRILVVVFLFVLSISISSVSGYLQYDTNHFILLEQEKQEALANYYNQSTNTIDNNDANGYLDDIPAGGGYISKYCRRKKQKPLHAPIPIHMVSGKKGIGLTLRTKNQSGYEYNVINLQRIKELRVYWNYGWSLNRIEEQQSTSSKFIPMIWGGSTNRQQLLQFVQGSNVQESIVNGIVPYVMGFNEPDHFGQSNYTVQQAINQWSVLHKLNVSLVSPSCVNPASQWMIDFMSNATERCLRVDYLGVHWYGWANAVVFKRNIINYWNLHKMPIIITEFAPADWTSNITRESNVNSPAAVLKFMKSVLPWLERTSFIYGYAWFPFLHTSPNGWSSALYFTNGTLTAAGRYYKSVKRFTPNGDMRIQPDPSL